MAWLKQSEEDVVLDNVSNGDFFTFAAALVMKDCEGPDVLTKIKLGRKDTTKPLDISSTPTSNNYKENLRAKGFSDAEIVALASIQSFGVVVDPKKTGVYSQPKFDIFPFKEALTKNSSPVPEL